MPGCPCDKIGAAGCCLRRSDGNLHDALPCWFSGIRFSAWETEHRSVSEPLAATWAEAGKAKHRFARRSRKPPQRGGDVETSCPPYLAFETLQNKRQPTQLPFVLGKTSQVWRPSVATVFRWMRDTPHVQSGTAQSCFLCPCPRCPPWQSRSLCSVFSVFRAHRGTSWQAGHWGGWMS